jgi:hypothetical protein
MSANVSLIDVSLTRVSTQRGNTQYDGTVTLRAQAPALEFNYAYKFTGMDSVPDAITKAAALLKRET